MHVLVLGGTGRTGRLVVSALLREGHRVTVLARPRTAPVGIPAGARIIEGDVLDARAVRHAVKGQDACVIVLGRSRKTDSDVCSRGTEIALRALAEAGGGRVVCVTGAMIGHPRERLKGMLRLMVQLPLRSFQEQLSERQRQEALVQESGLRWTLIRPPRLRDGPASPNVRVGEDLELTSFASVNRADVAALCARALRDESLACRAVSIAR